MQLEPIHSCVKANILEYAGRKKRRTVQEEYFVLRRAKKKTIDIIANYLISLGKLVHFKYRVLI